MSSSSCDEKRHTQQVLFRVDMHMIDAAHDQCAADVADTHRCLQFLQLVLWKFHTQLSHCILQLLYIDQPAACAAPHCSEWQCATVASLHVLTLSAAMQLNRRNLLPTGFVILCEHLPAGVHFLCHQHSAARSRRERRHQARDQRCGATAAVSERCSGLGPPQSKHHKILISPKLPRLLQQLTVLRRARKCPGK